MLCRGVNILLLDQYGELGGAQLCLLDLLPAILARRWRPLVAAPEDGPLLSRCRAMGAAAEPIRIRTRPAVRFALDSMALIRRLRALIERERVDVLYINGPRLVPAGVRAARNRCPVVFHCHSVFPRGTALVGRMLRSAGATVIASSEFVARPLAPYVSTQVIHNGVADHARARQPSAAPRIGVLGRISPEKGQAVFVEAVRLVQPQRLECRFVICGAPLFSDPSYAGEVRRAAAGLPIDFLEWQDDASVVLASLDLLVVPSTGEESTTRAIPEAFSAGVPVIASRTGGIPEIVDDGRTGVLVTPGSARELAQAITGMMESPRKRKEIAPAARREYEQRFRLDPWRVQVLDVLEAAAPEAGRRRPPGLPPPPSPAGSQTA